MPENRENKVYTTGPWAGNKCCHCCYRCEGDNTESFNNCTGCETTLCCSCPPLCDLEVVITATCCDGLDGVEFTMEKASWPQSPWNGRDTDGRERIRMDDHYCLHDNPTSTWQVDGLPCYEYDEELCRDQGNRHPYEKWANITYCPDYDHDETNGQEKLYRWGEMFCCNPPPGGSASCHDKHGTNTQNEQSQGQGCVCSGDCPDVVPLNCGDDPIDPDPVCRGQWMTFSLCCCDRQQSSMVADGYAGECKTCSYQFRTEWSMGSYGPFIIGAPYLPAPSRGVDRCLPGRTDLGTSRVCTCTDHADLGIQEAIPPDRGDSAGPGLPAPGGNPWAPGHGNGYVMIWEHVAGECGFSEEGGPIDPADWRMEFRLGTACEPVHWNCDCCFNTIEGDEIGLMKSVKPKRQAYFTAIITAKAGTCQSDGGP